MQLVMNTAASSPLTDEKAIARLATDSENVDPFEAERYAALASTWWDRSGPFWPLHRLNELRTVYLKDVIAPLFGRDPDSDKPFRDIVADMLNGNRHEWCGGRRLPDHGVATDRSYCGIPGPNSHREIEGRDNADRAQGMPLLVHAVPGTLGVHGESVKLA